MYIIIQLNMADFWRRGARKQGLEHGYLDVEDFTFSLGKITNM